jgi:hypothetical protein
MNRKARHTSTRSLGLAGISTLFAGLVAVFGQSAAPNSRTPHGAISAESHGLDAVLLCPCVFST